MSAENRLYFFRMCAWGMFDPDDLPRHERKVRIRQIRQVFQECGFHLDIGKASYTLYKGNPQFTSSASWLGADKKLSPICQKILPIVNAKFPPAP